ncbi:TonB-dependent receptor plug domain-containing protein [Megasphaera cerevisiae]|nr:TonB-dependent receptor [Megasphaera cerevisiae]
MNYTAARMPQRAWYAGLSWAIALWLTAPVMAAESPVGGGGNNFVTTRDVVVEADRAKEEAKLESQQTTIITREDIVKKQAKSVEDVIFSETGVSRTVDAMGRVGVSIRGAEPRHTLILVDGQAVMGDFAKYYGAADELLRQGTENVERIEIIQGAASAKYGSDAIGGVINIITRKPAKTAGIEANVEGLRVKGNSDVFPYQNVFLRADSGQMGKLRLMAYGSKRDIMPVFSKNFKDVSVGSIFLDHPHNFDNALRYYGTADNIGISGSYDIDDHNTLDFKADHYTEDLKRDIKHSNSPMEPVQKFRRTADRNSYNLAWTGNNQGNTDWKVEMSYARLKENDIGLTSDYNTSIYEGKNILNYLDDIDHRQYDFKATANTQVNDQHMLTYGGGYSYEEGSGSRIKNAPDTYTRSIDPWDYDKSLQVDLNTGVPSSTIHDYKMEWENGAPRYDQDYEWYGYDRHDAKTQAPAFTYESYSYYLQNKNVGSGYVMLPPEEKKKYDDFSKQLAAESGIVYDPINNLQTRFLADNYYRQGNLKFNGQTFQEEYLRRNNRQAVGRASIRKENFFVQDTWQINANTILSPIIRFDHSSLFGSNISANMGMTHNLGGNVHRRLKANFGTGYTEPGMGELYYNWEMYGGNPVMLGISKLGWYWAGNPDLKPEESVNMDLSIEGENANTYARAGIFYNRIRNYMTTYFTGSLMDFSPGLTEDTPLGSMKFASAPDMIYSFKNIGKAEITGFQASVEQKLGSHWKAKLGYAWLHAINKSDPDMPRQLLDKPQHKIDIGISYDDIQSGWSGSLWGDYYINMLDSNSIAGNGNYMISSIDPDDKNKSIIKYFFAENGKQTYEKKTFGIWNVIVQKKMSKDSLVYFGVDNLFNHHDDDRALQERVYKFGVNMKVGYNGTKKQEDKKAVVTNAVAGSVVVEKNVQRDTFITAPFEVNKKPGVELIGDYQARWNVHGGTDKPVATVTTTTHVGDAAKNMLDQKGHGFEQRLRLGFDARIGDNTNVTVLGSAAGMSGVDTKHDVSDSKGLNHQRLDTIDVTQHANKWDFSVGRLTEPMGVTGYWFGKEYDGGRAVWTSGKNQVRLGYGDFSSSTGISDSAYTHATKQTFYRNPTLSEFVGLEVKISGTKKEVIVSDSGSNVNFFQQLKAAKTPTEQLAVVKKLYDLSHAAYGDYVRDDWTGEYRPKTPVVSYVYEKDGQEYTDTTGISYAASQQLSNISYNNGSPLQGDGAAYLKNWWETNETIIVDNLTERAKTACEKNGYTFKGLVESKEDIYTDLIDRNLGEKSGSIFYKDEDGKDVFILVSGVAASYFDTLVSNLNMFTEDRSTLPRVELGKVIGAVIKVTGTVLQKDTIPAIERAAYIQAKHSFSPDFGVMAWYLRSTGDDNHSFAAARGDNAAVSLDYGQNRTDFARYMNGHTIYENHEAGNSTFDFGGRASGGTPHFWVARVDIGKSDTDRPGSWNAFADYKYFQHGSFFGGNGTEGVPDRYLDGIKSFTVGGGYVPAKDILLEAFYTFDAKGIGKRDTLYGSENFSLGDYTRIQMTYKF